MKRPAVRPAGLADPQSFDRVADDYDRLGELTGDGLIGPWLLSQLPLAGGRAADLGCGTGRHAVLLSERFAHVDAIDLSGPMIELARQRRPLPNIAYRQADLLEIDGTCRYDFVLSALTLHHVPDLHAALNRIKTLLAPAGRLVVVDVYEAEPAPARWAELRRIAERLLPLRLRLRGLAAMRSLALLVRRGPATAWEIYRLSASRDWLDHRVSDRFFTREQLERSCRELFPGCRLDELGGPRGIGLVWDAPG